MDKVVAFRALGRYDLERILDIELHRVQERIAAAQGGEVFVFQCTAPARQFPLAEGTDPRYGARHLKRAIERHVVFPLSSLLATGQVGLGDNRDRRLRALWTVPQLQQRTAPGGCSCRSGRRGRHAWVDAVVGAGLLSTKVAESREYQPVWPRLPCRGLTLNGGSKMTDILKESFACTSLTLLLGSLLFAAASVGLVAVYRLASRLLTLS